MSTFSDKIKVNYTDLTNYVNIESGDILGCAFEYHWGETDKLLTLTKGDFFKMYPESVVSGTFTLNGNESRYNAYAQIKKFFENGGELVECVRAKGNWQYFSKNITSSASTASATASDNQFPTASNSAKIEVATKYAGMFPTSMIPSGCTGVMVVVDYNSTTAVMTVTVKGYTGTASSPVADVILETFKGGLTMGEYVDGQPYFIDDVVNNNSKYINIKYTALPSSFATATVVFAPLATLPTATAWTSTMIDTFFKDRMLSNCTLLISPTNDETLNNDIVSIANTRQNCIAVVGLNVATTFTKANVITSATATTKDKFCVYIAGREVLELFGGKIPSNCVGGWCGSTSAVAETVRINQLASAFTYGQYLGVLSDTLSLDDACDLMDNYGVTSVVGTSRGNYIWGIKTTYSITTSYFAYANVMRVLSNFLRNAFPIAMSALHTDASANELTRSSFQQKFSNIVDNLVATQNLKADSYIECMGDINSDENTNGGRIFNVYCSLHFISLTESVVFNIVATDSSVSTTL